MLHPRSSTPTHELGYPLGSTNSGCMTALSPSCYIYIADCFNGEKMAERAQFLTRPLQILTWAVLLLTAQWSVGVEGVVTRTETESTGVCGPSILPEVCGKLLMINYHAGIACHSLVIIINSHGINFHAHLL